MAKCSSCKQDSKTRLDNNNLCKKCAEATKAAEKEKEKEKEMYGIDLDKSIAELSVRELIGVINKITGPIEKNIADINVKVKKNETQIKILEKEVFDKSEKIALLTNIIINMQKSLNMIDMEDRATNVMISGVTETDFISQDENGDEMTMKTDKDKVIHILEAISVTIPTADIRECERIGKEKEDYNRMIKLKVRTKEQRNEITKNAAKLKNIPRFNKIYVKKDTHPVYVQETSRIRTKMKKLKEEEENKDKDIRIEDGVLKVDGRAVDKNTFFV